MPRKTYNIKDKKQRGVKLAKVRITPLVIASNTRNMKQLISPSNENDIKKKLNKNISFDIKPLLFAGGTCGNRRLLHSSGPLQKEEHDDRLMLQLNSGRQLPFQNDYRDHFESLPFYLKTRN